MGLLNEIRFRPVIDCTPDEPYLVKSGWSTQDAQLVFEVNGCLYSSISRYDLVDVGSAWEIQKLILYKLMPLVFLSMPVHDAPIIIHRGKPVV